MFRFTARIARVLGRVLARIRACTFSSSCCSMDVSVDTCVYRGEGDASPVEAKHSENRGILLDQQDEWLVAVKFMRIYSDLPLFYAQVQEGNNADRNKTPFIVCLSHNGHDYPVNLAFATSRPFAPVPRAPSDNNGIQDFQTGNGEYYRVDCFQQWIDIINTALQDSFNQLKAAHPTADPKTAPWVQLNRDSGILELIYEFTYSKPNQPTLWCNSLFYNYFEGIHGSHHGYNNANGKDINITLAHRKGNENAYALHGDVVPPYPASNPEYLRSQADRNYLFLWTNIQGVLLTSSSISVKHQALPKGDNPNALQSLAADTRFQTNFESVLSYFDVISTDTAAARETIFYSPTVLHWINLTSSGKLERLDLHLKVLLTDGTTMPLMLASRTGSVDVKLVFMRNA